MLVHICCSVDSHYFLQKLKKEHPNEKLIGFFYDPNIHPYSEYYLRLLDVKRSCKMLGVELVEGIYDTASWLKSVSGLENEPEKGARCSVCFDDRLEISAQKAKELEENTFTSTLLVSPKKSIAQLKKSGNIIAKRYELTFITPDYRLNGGTQEQNIIAKQDKLYRQDYCGCLFGLTQQREQQKKIADELFSPLSTQILPDSIEEKIELYEKRCRLEEKSQKYIIKKERFLNYRLKRAYVSCKDQVIASHFLPYSTLQKGYTRGKIMWGEKMGYLNRDEVLFITLAHYNEMGNANYKDVRALIYNPPSFKKELQIRKKLTQNPYNLSTIIVLQEKINAKLEIYSQSEIYEDIRQIIKLTD
ncbi:MAG: epoxyqueuosine reductase QueH [Campylobacterales bacterium]|nr:epoxyqueuosine reductase QueH [Campylobacterales bacterium]